MLGVLIRRIPLTLPSPAAIREEAPLAAGEGDHLPRWIEVAASDCLPAKEVLGLLLRERLGSCLLKMPANVTSIAIREIGALHH